MLLIIEGADGVGKSTLVDEVTRYLRKWYPSDTVEVWRKGPPRHHPLDEYVTPLISYRPGRGHHIICDRWHLGELVYPKIFRRESLMDDGQLLYAELFLKSRGAYLALIQRDHVDVQKTLATRGDDLVIHEQAIPIILSFHQAYRRSTLTKSASHIAQESLAEWLIAEAARVELKAQLLNDFTTYVGPADPHLLILGDVRGPGNPHPDGPAFGPYPATSGAHLMRALTATLTPRRRVGIANACDVDSVTDMLSVLRPAEVVTLGANAYKSASLVASNFGAAAHPQFMRRFHHKHHAAYGHTIVKAATTGEDLRSWRP
jgi:thymidylate kinase